MKTFPEIQTENYLLRQIDAGDLENIYSGLSNGDVVKYYDISFGSLEETKEQMAWYAELEKTGKGIWWAISSKDRKIFFGAVGYNNRHADYKKADFGFWLLPEFWGNGVLRETVPKVCEYGFKVLKLNRIEAQVESENKACKSLMLKVNFKHEGTLREYEIKNRQFIDLEIYSKLRSDMETS